MNRAAAKYIFVAVAGAIVSAYLVFHDTKVFHGLQNEPSFCVLGTLFDCDKVARSAYSHVGQFPVASFGLAFYLGVLAFSLAFPADEKQEDFLDVMLAVCGLALVPTIYFASISMSVLGTFCILCIATYICTLLLAAFAARSQNRRGTVLQSFFRGWKLIAEFFSFRSAGRAIVVPSIFALAGIAGTSFLAPSYILNRIFLPEMQKYEAEKHASRSTDLWKKEPARLIDTHSGPGVPPPERDFATGPQDSAVKVIVFSDFECPYCRIAAQIFHDLAKSYRFQLIFKNFPLDRSCNEAMSRELHQFACRAAEMARCAGIQRDDLFWAVHDGIYSLKKVDEQSLSGLAQQVPGLDQEKFQACLSSGEGMRGIKRDVKEAMKLKLEATPGIFVNGKQVRNMNSDIIREIVRLAAAGWKVQ